MPQTITPRVHKSITLAANDLCTVNYTGKQDGGKVFVANYGPGVVWASADPTVNAAVANVDCYRLPVNGTVTFCDLGTGSKITLNADTASTLVSLVFQ